MGDGTKQNPYTREDVIKAIEENGGTAKGLDLSGKTFEDGIDLRGLDLREVIFRDARFPTNSKREPVVGANLMGIHLEKAILAGVHLEGADLIAAYLEEAYLTDAHLEGADLRVAHLEWAYLVVAHLEEAYLTDAHLEGADLTDAHLKGAYLNGIEFSADTRLELVDWGNYILGQEKERDFHRAEDTYRRLKQWYTNAGIYDIAGEFFFREMTAQRKRIKWWPHPTQRKRLNWWLHPRHRLWSKFVSLICGYGERPLRVILWSASVVLVSALVYFLSGSVWEWSAFWNYLYFSAVSFTALGYGSWLQATNDWIRGIGAFESFVGVFTIALFLITFTRKMRR